MTGAEGGGEGAAIPFRRDRGRGVEVAVEFEESMLGAGEDEEPGGFLVDPMHQMEPLWQP